MTASSVFISYSHKDEEWKDRLVTHLGVLEQAGILDLWEDRRIEAGDDWQPEIEKAINKAAVAILMISANFLTSKFILGEEVPKLLKRRTEEGVRVIPLIVKPCAWTQVSWLSPIQARPKDGKPLSGGNENQIDTDLAALAEEISQLIKRADALRQKQEGKKVDTFEDKKMSIVKNPVDLTKLEYVPVIIPRKDDFGNHRETYAGIRVDGLQSKGVRARLVRVISERDGELNMNHINPTNNDLQWDIWNYPNIIKVVSDWGETTKFIFRNRKYSECVSVKPGIYTLEVEIIAGLDKITRIEKISVKIPKHGHRFHETGLNWI